MKRFIILFTFVLISVSTSLTFPSHADAASCPAGTTAKPKMEPITGLTMVDGCYRGDKLVGYAGFNSYVQIEPISCKGTYNYSKNLPDCILRSFSVWAGTTLISASAFLLTITGLLFNLVITKTIALFSTTLATTGAQSFINVAWTIFRDIANILIVGIFIYLAIMIIAGQNSRGKKQYIAHVIVVATLINFSLLFSVTIVKVGNAVATTIYPALTGEPVASLQKDGWGGGVGFGITTNDPRAFPRDGVAGSFIKMLGITGLSDTKEMLDEVAETNDSASLPILHGLFAATVLLFASAVFLFASLLLVVRVVILLFLMILGPIAFAAFLIPNYSDKFLLWWRNLIQYSLIAPVLFLLLLVTKQMATAVTAGSGGGTLGGALGKPGEYTNIVAFLNYFLVVGMLVLTVYLTIRFAQVVAGGNWAAALTLLPITGTALGAAAVLRNWRGARAYREINQRNTEIEATKMDRSLTSEARIEKLRSLMEMRDKATLRSGKEYNAMNAKVFGRSIGDRIGGLVGTVPKPLSRVITGTTEGGGYAGRVKTAVKEGEGEFKDLGYSGAEQEKFITNLQKETAQQKETVENSRRAAKELADETRDSLQSARDEAKTAATIEMNPLTKRQQIEVKKQVDTLKDKPADERETAMSGMRERIRKAVRASLKYHDAETELKLHDRDVNTSMRRFDATSARLDAQLQEQRQEGLTQLQGYAQALGNQIASKVGDDVGKAIAKNVGISDSLKQFKKELEKLPKAVTSAQQRATRLDRRASTLEARTGLRSPGPTDGTFPPPRA